MHRTLVSGLTAAILLVAPAAFALDYVGPSSYSYGYGSAYATPACVSLTSDLSFGMRGGQVSSLQSFLVSRNYPGGGSWMVTGYFGNATLQALKIFQGERGVPATGVTDSATRSAILQATCGGGSQNYSNTYPYLSYPYNYNYNFNTTYPTYPYTSGQLALTSISQNTGAPGTSVTLYGVGFDSFGNTVNFGTQSLSGISSANGTSLIFTVPSYLGYSFNQSVQITVTNSRGTSNPLSFTVMYAPYNYCNGYPYPYANNCYQYQAPTQNLQSPLITYLNPAQGGVGTSVTVFGSGFSTSGNTVRFGNGIIANLNSADGLSVSFVVPSQLSGYGSQPVVLGSYNVSVTNSSGYTSNSMPFVVTSLGNSGIAPSISSIQGPTTLQSGVQGTWTITVNNPSGSYLTTSVDWGETAPYASLAAPQTTYAQGLTTLTFTHTYYQTGTKNVVFTVSNPSSQSNTGSATVSVTSSGTPGSISLTSIVPSAAHIGNQIQLLGSGFSATDNTVKFGIGGTLHVPSFNNGTLIYYTVPQFVSPCDLVIPGSQTVCAQYIQQVMPGPIQVSVQNGSATSNVIMFQVQ